MRDGDLDKSDAGHTYLLPVVSLNSFKVEMNLIDICVVLCAPCLDCIDIRVIIVLCVHMKVEKIFYFYTFSQNHVSGVTTFCECGEGTRGDPTG